MLIQNAKLHLGDGTVIPNGWLRIENNVIHSVGTMETLSDSDGDICDAGGRDVTPGLIDAHCHVGMFEDGMNWEGDDGNEITDPITPHVRGIDGCNARDRAFDDALCAGVTCVMTGPGSANPVGGQFAALKTLGGRVDDMILVAPAAMKFATGENPKGCYGKKDKLPQTRMGVAACIRDALFQTRAYTKKENPDFNFKWEALKPVLSREVPAHFHSHRADDIFTVLRIAREFDLDFVLVHGTDSACIADELAREGVQVITGPALCDRSKIELKANSFETPNALYKAGLRPAICTDAPVIPIEYLPICAGLAHKSGLPYEEAIAAVTGNAARILKLENRIGFLKPGLDADVVLWEGSPLTLEAVPQAVWLNGRLVKGHA